MRVELDGKLVGEQLHEEIILFDPAGHEMDAESTKYGVETLNHKFIFADVDTGK